jgi:hypothetical protein
VTRCDGKYLESVDGEQALEPIFNSAATAVYLELNGELHAGFLLVNMDWDGACHGVGPDGTVQTRGRFRCRLDEKRRWSSLSSSKPSIRRGAVPVV